MGRAAAKPSQYAPSPEEASGRRAAANAQKYAPSPEETSGHRAAAKPSQYAPSPEETSGHRAAAMELIDRLPYLRCFQAPNNRMLEAWIREVAEGDDCVEWAKAVKTVYLREHDPSGKCRPPSPAVCVLRDEIKRRFEKALSDALGIAPEEVEAFIAAYLAENL